MSLTERMQTALYCTMYIHLLVAHLCRPLAQVCSTHSNPALSCRCSLHLSLHLLLEQLLNTDNPFYVHISNKPHVTGPLMRKRF